MADIDWTYKRNLTMLTDFYEMTMGNGYIINGLKNEYACFDMFFRRIPDNGGYAIMAGVEQMIEYLKNLHFTEEDISYLRSKQIFQEEFLEYLSKFTFNCNVWAIPEGTPIFPGEPIVKVMGPIVEAQLVETMILLTINHQSLIATKANRIVQAADKRPVMEFGSRRAHSYDSAILGARAAFIGGCVGTACTITDRDFFIPALGTMAHSWIQVFDTELEAFKAYARCYPDNCTLLVDTFHVLKSGVPNAIKAFDEEIVPRGFRPKGIRIDSGDIAYLSKEARKMLDNSGYADCKIVASNSLDEYKIGDLLSQGAKIDSFGVGERLITASSEPVFGGVYKLAAIEKNGEISPRIKISDNVGKITNPGVKKVYRLYDRDSQIALADVITLSDEIIDDTKPYVIFDPVHIWKRKTLTNFKAKELLVPIFENGTCVYKSPEIQVIQKYCREQVNTLWEEVRRFDNPHEYYVDLSEQLWKLKNQMIERYN